MSPTQIVRSEVQPEPAGIGHDDLIDSLSADAVPDEVIGLIDGTEQPPLTHIPNTPRPVSGPHRPISRG